MPHVNEGSMVMIEFKISSHKFLFFFFYRLIVGPVQHFSSNHISCSGVTIPLYMFIDTSSTQVESDVSSAAALVKLFRALHDSCERSYRWSSVPQGDAANHLKVCLLRRVVTMLRRTGHSIASTTITPAGIRSAFSSRHMTRSQHTATLAAVVSSAIRPSALRDVEEFKMLMWDSLSVVFNNDQALADVVISLAKDNVALEDLVHDSLIDLNSIGGNTPPGAYDYDHLEEVPCMQSTTSSSRHNNSRLQRLIPHHASSQGTPDHSMNSSIIFPAAALHYQQQTPIQKISPQGEGNNNKALRSTSLTNYSLSRGVGGGAKNSPITDTVVHGTESSSSTWGLSPGGKLWSRQTLLIVLFLLVMVSVTTSLKAWRELKRGEAAGKFSNGSKRRHHRTQSGSSHSNSGHSTHSHDVHLPPEAELPPQNQQQKVQEIASTPPSTVQPVPPTTKAPPAPKSGRYNRKRKRNGDILQSLRQKEQELVADIMNNRATPPSRNRVVQQFANTPIPLPAATRPPPGPKQTATSPCGSDSTKNPSGLPGRSYDPVDSITALSF
ncbi:Hypothetical protein, putative, partial [Bodo saltans]